MQWVRLLNQTQNNVLCERCAIANNLFTRVRGLLGRSELPTDEGLLITPCPSIHMFGMKFAIDVVFLSKDDVVVDLIEAIAPGKLYVATVPDAVNARATEESSSKNDKQRFKPYAAIELPVGSIGRNKTQIFDKIMREPRSP